MKASGLSLVAATLAGLIIGTSYPVVAQSATEIQAGALLQSAERLERDSDDSAAITMAYEQALAAYDDLGDTDQSLKILDTLYRVNYSACRYDAAVRWGREAVGRYELPRRDFDLNDKLREYRRWVIRLGNVYGETRQSEQLLALYTAALENLDTLPPSVDDAAVFEVKAEFLRSQLTLYPSDSRESSITRQRLLAVRERLGVITEVDGLISDAIYLRDVALGRYSAPAVDLLQRVLEQSRLNNYSTGEIKAVTLLSQQFLANDDYDQAISHSDLVLTSFNQLDRAAPWLAIARYVLAQSEQAVGNDAEAIEHYEILLAEMDSAPEYRIDVSKYDVVVSLFFLYDRAGNTAQVDQLAREHRDLLEGNFPTRPLPRASAIPPVVLSPYSFRTCRNNPVRLPNGLSDEIPIIPSPPAPPTLTPSTILSPE